MKTQVLSFVAIAAIVLGIGNTTLAAGNPDSNREAAKTTEVSTVLTNVSHISKIEVYGNVELYISDNDADQVKVYNKYYEQSALVQSQNGVLKISSYADQKLVVWVKASDLRSITVNDNAEVRSFGKISPIELNVTLNNNAYAKLNFDGFGVNITVNDRAKADLSGTVTQCNLKYNHSATVNSTEFVAERITRTVDGLAVADKNKDQFAGL
ncbi:MAG: GIN domain-containing protein [Sphingobacteriales bacterium]